MSDVYNTLPELTRVEKQTLLDRAVRAAIDVYGIPRDHEAQQAFDLSVDLRFTMGCFTLQQALAAQTRRLADEALFDAG